MTPGSFDLTTAREITDLYAVDGFQNCFGFDKQVNTTELQPGSFNQTLVGSVLTFPIRDISMPMDDMRPQTADGSTLADMDITVIYSINAAQVGVSTALPFVG